MVNKPKTYSAKERNVYLFGMLGENILLAVIMVGLSYYLQFTILIPAFTVGAIMAVAKIWDAVNDPLMGMIVDRTKTKIGKCRVYLLAAPIPVYIATVLCFLNFGFYDASKSALDANNALILGWALLTYLLWGMAFTIGDIPLWGITALMTQDDKARAKLLSYARIALLIGSGGTVLFIQPAAIAMGKRFAQFYVDTPTLSAAAAGERAGFIAVAIIFGFVGVVLFQPVGIFVKEKIAVTKKPEKFKKSFSVAWKNKPFRQILISGILSSPKALLTFTLTPLITYYYASKDAKAFVFYMALWSGSMFAGQIIAMLLVPRLIRKHEKKDVYNRITLFGAIPFISMFALYLSAPTRMAEPLFVAIFMVFLFACGAANGGSTVLQSVMIADAVDYEEYRSGTRPDGLFFSGVTFISKLGAGISVIISGIFYALSGFSGANVAQVNAFIARGGIPRLESLYSNYMMVLFFLVSVPPAIGSILAVIPTWKYSLSAIEYNKVITLLNQRRSAEESVQNEEQNSQQASQKDRHTVAYDEKKSLEE